MFQTHAMGFDDLGISIDEPFPTDVEFMISALEAGPRPLVDRQRFKRIKYRVRSMLRLYSEGPDVPPTLLYTRNISSQGMGFLCPRQLPISHGGVVMIPNLNGDLEKIACVVLRCREAANRWCEGAVHFNRSQISFDADHLLASGYVE
jgi:hypothetical protein